MLDVFVARLTDVGRNLGQPDGSLDGLYLAEERPHAAESVMTPVLQQAGSLRGDAPVGRIWDLAPTVHLVADTVDDRGVGVLLLLGRQPLALIKDEVRLFGLALLLPRGRDRSYELSRAAAINDLLRRLAARVELPMSSGVVVGRIQDRTFKKSVGHFGLCCCSSLATLSRAAICAS